MAATAAVRAAAGPARPLLGPAAGAIAASTSRNRSHGLRSRQKGRRRHSRLPPGECRHDHLAEHVLGQRVPRSRVDLVAPPARPCRVGSWQGGVPACGAGPGPHGEEALHPGKRRAPRGRYPHVAGLPEAACRGSCMISSGPGRGPAQRPGSGFFTRRRGTSHTRTTRPLPARPVGQGAPGASVRCRRRRAGSIALRPRSPGTCCLPRQISRLRGLDRRTPGTPSRTPQRRRTTLWR